MEGINNKSVLMKPDEAMLLNDGRDENTKLFIRSVYSANWKN